MKTKLDWKTGYACLYGKYEIVLSNNFDLDADYNNPRSHIAIYKDGLKVRVIVDHDATGTKTSGTGDTRVRSIPRGWKSGSREYAN